jgi:hypothetical protein
MSSGLFLISYEIYTMVKVYMGSIRKEGEKRELINTLFHKDIMYEPLAQCLWTGCRIIYWA